MRSSARLWAAADFGVRFWWLAISFSSASCISVLRGGRSVPCGQYQRGRIPGTATVDFTRRQKARPSRAAPLDSLSNCCYALEVELQRELHQPWIASAFDAAKIQSVCDIAVRVQELRMIEDIKKLSPELEVRSLS